jgi:hypothetical protein
LANGSTKIESGDASIACGSWRMTLLVAESLAAQLFIRLLRGWLSSRKQSMPIDAGPGPGQEIYSIDECFIGVAGVRGNLVARGRAAPRAVESAQFLRRVFAGRRKSSSI